MRNGAKDGGATAATPLLAAAPVQASAAAPAGAGVAASGPRMKSGERRRSSVTAKAVAAGGDWSYLADHTQEVSTAPKGAKAKWAAMKKFVRRSSVTEKTEVTDEDIEIACMYLKDAQHGRGIGYRVDTASRRVYRLFHARWWVVTYLCVACFDMGIVMLEKPSVPDSLWFGPWLPVLLEAACMVVYLADLALLYRFFLNGYERTRFWCHKWSLVRLIVIGAMVLDLTLNLSSDYISVRFSRPLRPLMIIGRTRNVRQVFLGCLITLYRILPMFVLIGFHIMFFAFIGNVIFGGLRTSMLFATLPDSVSTLWRTTTSTPVNLDIITGYWDSSAWSSLFATIFLVVGNIILFKLFIASSFRSYKQYTRRKTMSRIKKRRVALNATFKLLALTSARHSDAHAVSRDVWFRVMRKLRPNLTDDVLDVMFSAVDTEGEGEVNIRSFMNLCALITVKFKMHPDIAGWPRLNAWRRAGRVYFNYSVWVMQERVVMSDMAVGALVCLSAVQMYKEAELQHSMDPDTSLANTWHAIGVVTLLLFIAEGVLRALCFGVKRYLDSYFHILDVLCNVCGVGYFLIVASNPHPDDGPSDLRLALNVVLIFRLLRLLKLLAVFSPTKKILWTLQRVAPSMARLLFIIVAVFYGFAIVGVDVFQDIPGPKGYVTELTFDSFPASMLTLFEVSMLSSWPMVLDVTQAHTTKWAQVFFYLFHVIVVMLLLPVFIGFIVESFVSNYAQVEAEFKKEESEVRDRYQRWKQEHTLRKQRRLKRAQRSNTRDGSKRRLRGGIDGGSVGSGMDSGAESVPGSTVAVGVGGGTGAGPSDDASVGSDTGSEHSVAFNYEEEAAVEMAIRRRTSDVNYVMFDVSGALQQADYDKLLEQHKAQITELARRQERIHHMAGKLLSQTSEIRRLEAEVNSLRLALSRGTAGRAVSRLKQMSLTVKSRPPRPGAPEAPRSAESKHIRQTASMQTVIGARRGGQTSRRRFTEVVPRQRSHRTLLDAMAEAQAAAVLAQDATDADADAGSGGGGAGGVAVSPSARPATGGDSKRAAVRGRSNTDLGPGFDLVAPGDQVQSQRSHLLRDLHAEHEPTIVESGSEDDSDDSDGVTAPPLSSSVASRTSVRTGVSSVVTGGGAGLGMMVAGHESLWQDEDAASNTARPPVPVIAARTQSAAAVGAGGASRGVGQGTAAGARTQRSNSKPGMAPGPGAPASGNRVARRGSSSSRSKPST